MRKFIPYLSQEAIESDTMVLLAEYARVRGVTVTPPIPIEDIIEKHLRLGIEFDDTHRLFGVPRSRRDPDILGAMFFGERRIVIDESLDPEENPAKEGRYRFTLAHEGGHWRLHRLIFVNDLLAAASLGALDAAPVVCRARRAKERIEWQADTYASCLLMPRELILHAWRAQFGTADPIIVKIADDTQVAQSSVQSEPALIDKNSRHLFEPIPTFLFDDISRAFAPRFGVSALAMRIRLEMLGLLHHEVSAK